MGDWILIKFDISKEIMSQSSYFKSEPDLLTLGGGWRGKPEILENTWRDPDETWWIE